MVKNCWLLCFCFVVWGHSSESGSFSFLGRQYYEQGRYPEAYTQFYKALGATRKEADQKAEARIRMALARLTLEAQEFGATQEQLDSVRTDVLELSERVSLWDIQIELENAQNSYTKAFEIWQIHSQEMQEQKISSSLRAQVLCHVAIAASGMQRSSEAQELFSQAKKLYRDDAPGLLLYTEAQIAENLKTEDPRVLYEKALDYAVSSKRYYRAGSLLYHLGLLAEDHRDSAKAVEWYERSLGVFKELGLVKPFEQVVHRLVVLQGDSSPYTSTLKELREKAQD